MAYYPGQYGPYTTYNPQQQQGNYQQYGNYNPAQSTSHTTAPNTAYGITNNTSGAAVSQPSTQATDTPNYGYSYTNPATTTTNSSNPALHTISNLWYNQTTSAAQTAISQNSRTTQQQQVANYQAQMAQFYQHQANLVQQQQQQQQQQQMTAVQNMGGNQYKASPATKTESKISTAIPVSTTQQLNNWPYAAFMQMQQHHKPQEFPGFSKQTATKDESAGQNPSLSTTQQQSAYRSQPNTYQQPTNVKNGFVAGGDNWGVQQPPTIQHQSQVFSHQQQQQRIQYQQQLQQFQTFQQLAVNQRASAANSNDSNRNLGAKTNNYGTEHWGQQANTVPQVGNWNYGAQNNWSRDGGWGDWNGPRNSPRRAEDGPHIPPFPEAWQTDGVRAPPAGPLQDGGWEDRNRGSWGVGNNWQQQNFDQNAGNRMAANNNRYQRDDKGNNRYSPTSRPPRGGKGDRELWSPADNKKGDNKLSQANEIKAYLYAWMGVRHLRPIYDVQSIGERPEQTFRCELRVNNYKFVGVGEAETKKDAQTEAAWNMADYLVKQGELTEEELPSRTKSNEELSDEIFERKEEEVTKDRYDGRNTNQRPRRGGNWGAPKPSHHQPNMPHMGFVGHHMNFPPPPFVFEREMWGPVPPHFRGGPWMEGPPGCRGRHRGGNRGWNHQNEYWRRRDMEEQWMEEMHGEFQHPEDVFINRMIMNQQEATGYAAMMEGRHGDWNYGPSRIRNTVTLDDRHVMAKHASIYPHEEELRAVHQVVTVAERSLKALSDKFVDEDHPLEKTPEELEEEREEEQGGDEKKNEDEDKSEKKSKIQILRRPKRRNKKVPDLRPRVLSAVNRVGPLAKGLLIHDDARVDLVLLCGEIPTEALLRRVMDNLPEQVKKIDKSLKFRLEEIDSGFKLFAHLNVEIELTVTFTSTVTTFKKPDEQVESTSEQKDDETPSENDCPETDDSSKDARGNEVSEKFPKSILLGALARLRHAKWFQARASQQDSCVVITRILRDLQKRDPVWGALSSWALENIVYIALSSSTEHMSPGDALRRFFEVAAGGILLPDRAGIQDPCEKEQIDVLDCCTDQQLNDITKSAQNFLLKIAFREVHKVLGMERVNAMHRHMHFPHSPVAMGAEEEGAHQRKRRFEPNHTDTSAESPKRSLTDEEDLDQQPNLAELTISENESPPDVKEHLPEATNDTPDPLDIHSNQEKDQNLASDAKNTEPADTTEASIEITKPVDPVI